MNINPFGLKTGALYTGEQTTTSSFFRIDMSIDKLIFFDSLMCGSFTIYNLTPNIKTIKTYFEGQIIGDKYKFSDNPDDIHYWARFYEWKHKYIDFPDSYNPKNSNFLYIKIKEMFLLPEFKNVHLSSASIDGYYYCCYHKKTDSFKGFYQIKDTGKNGTQEIFLTRINSRLTQSYQTL